jgi:anti-sigma B factor antagonist
MMPHQTGSAELLMSFVGSSPAGECAGATEARGPARCAVDVLWRADVATVQPRGDLDLVSVATVQAALDGSERTTRLVLDLSGVSFIDSAGLHLLVGAHHRAQRDKVQLSIVAPAAPADLAIRSSGLYEELPFVAAGDAHGGEPRHSLRGPHVGG